MIETILQHATDSVWGESERVRMGGPDARMATGSTVKENVESGASSESQKETQASNHNPHDERLHDSDRSAACVLNPSPSFALSAMVDDNPRKLTQLSCEEVKNPSAEQSVWATLFCVIHIAAFAYWLRKVFVGYEAWRAGVGSLPETGIVKVGIPMFLASIAVELILALSTRAEVYRLNDSLASMSNGLLQTILDAVIFNVLGEILGVVFITAIPYHLIHEHWRIVRLEGFWGFIGMIFARDLCYYWFHRVSHRVAFMWAVHGVHHQPNEFNYSVNLSQGALQRVTEVVFYAPLALFFPPEVYVLVYPIAKIYGFFTHTRLVSKPFLLEWFFVTPSAHRVHHAGAPSIYIDKNYSECFTIWDRYHCVFCCLFLRLYFLLCRVSIPLAPSLSTRLVFGCCLYFILLSPFFSLSITLSFSHTPSLPTQALWHLPA